ncbi:hypothetical protein TgHK011_007219 [Trichoderma gracile]|nr:hypothetical protein TgHK011_007219 [Trichoderma gracile]
MTGRTDKRPLCEAKSKRVRQKGPKSFTLIRGGIREGKNVAARRHTSLALFFCSGCAFWVSTHTTKADSTDGGAESGGVPGSPIAAG